METLPITGLPRGGVSESVIVCGDPERAQKISRYLERGQLLSRNREYNVYQGQYQGVTITVCSHGVGAPGAAIAFEELIAAGGRRIIRVGSCGGFQKTLKSGDIVIAAAAVQHTGYGRETVPNGYPAVADLDVSFALREAAKNRGIDCPIGIVLTRDNFYAGAITNHTPNYVLLAEANVLAVEMECAALFIIGSLRGVQTGAILAVDGNVLHGPSESMETYQPHREIVTTAVSACIQIALDAVVMMDS